MSTDTGHAPVTSAPTTPRLADGVDTDLAAMLVWGVVER